MISLYRRINMSTIRCFGKHGRAPGSHCSIEASDLRREMTPNGASDYRRRDAAGYAENGSTNGQPASYEGRQIPTRLCPGLIRANTRKCSRLSLKKTQTEQAVNKHSQSGSCILQLAENLCEPFRRRSRLTQQPKRNVS